MEKSNGNIPFYFRSKENLYTPKTPAKNEIPVRTPFGLRSNDRMSSKSGSTQNVMLTEKYNRDIELIRKMQRQGVIRKITKKDSLNLRKNNFLVEKEKDLNQLTEDSKNFFFKDQNPYLLFKKKQDSHTMKSNSEGHRPENFQSKHLATNHNSVDNRKVSLYSKLQDSLQKYMSSHSKELTLQGNKRFLGKSGDYYLQSKKGAVINEMTEILDSSLNSSNNSKNLSPKKKAPFGMNQKSASKETKNVGKVVTFTKKNFSKNNLTPIPLVQKKKLKNSTEKQECSKAERTAVQIRRIEYANSMKEKAIKMRTNIDPRKVEAAVKIQAWWRVILFRNRKLIKLQAFIRGFLARKGINELISYANILNLRLTQLTKTISLPFLKPCFDKFYDNFAVEAQANDFLNIVIFLQRRIRKFLMKNFEKSAKLRRAFQKIQELFSKRLKDPFKLIRISKIGMLRRQKRYFKYNKGFDALHKFFLKRRLLKLVNYARLKKIVEQQLYSKELRTLYFFLKMWKKLCLKKEKLEKTGEV